MSHLPKRADALPTSSLYAYTTTDTAQEHSGALVNTFDAEEVQKELDVSTRVTQKFNTVAPTLIGDYATIKANELRSQGDEAEAAKWEEGGVYRVALHSAVGGLSADVSGALGAGVSAAAIPTIGDIINNANIPNELKTPLIEIAGTAIGVAAGSAGGDGMAGGVSANMMIENNYKRHEAIKQQQEWMEKDIITSVVQLENNEDGWFALDPNAAALYGGLGENAENWYLKDAPVAENILAGLEYGVMFGYGTFWSIKELGYASSTAWAGGLVSGGTGFGIGYTSSMGLDTASPQDFIKDQRDEYFKKSPIQPISAISEKEA